MKKDTGNEDMMKDEDPSANLGQKSDPRIRAGKFSVRTLQLVGETGKNNCR